MRDICSVMPSVGCLIVVSNAGRRVKRAPQVGGERVPASRRLGLFPYFRFTTGRRSVLGLEKIVVGSCHGCYGWYWRFVHWLRRTRPRWTSTYDGARHTRLCSPYGYWITQTGTFQPSVCEVFGHAILGTIMRCAGGLSLHQRGRPHWQRHPLPRQYVTLTSRVAAPR